jgi:hypothetical protein
MNAAFCHEIARSKKAHCRLQKPHVVRSVEEIFGYHGLQARLSSLLKGRFPFSNDSRLEF